jgi:hypothetical protein
MMMAFQAPPDAVRSISTRGVTGPSHVRATVIKPIEQCQTGREDNQINGARPGPQWQQRPRFAPQNSHALAENAPA